jgi:hypothetical protein
MIMNESEEKKTIIRLTKADYKRAYKKAKQFKKLLEKGKKRDEIFKNLLFQKVKQLNNASYL